MIKKNISVCIVALMTVTVLAQENQVLLTDPIAKGRIILKIKSTFKSLCNKNEIKIANYNELISSFGGKLTKSFPFVSSPATEKDNYGNKLVDLTTVYEISFDTLLSITKIIAALSSLPETEYCQPVYLPQLLYTPDDPGIGSQYYLTNIKAYQAWDTCKGDSNIIIGVTDTGIENAHEDLIDNIFYNYNDLINGIDDDHDGFVDNFRGWDLGNNDNSPEWNEDGNGNGFITHGINVSGLAGARTNNGKGIAATGFRTKILPVKISDSSGVLIRAYEGIVYAADHGCSIINCSWGGQTPHPYGQDIVNYATFNRNALVIAAVGNDGLSTNAVLYPASFDNVLSVAATIQSDIKWDKSTSGPQVDVCAPGYYIYSTRKNSGYTWCEGTSMASPIAASCAALIKAWYSDTLTALQLGEILRMTCDNIDTITGNLPYAGNLGRGRVNLYRALTDTLPPAVKFINYNFTTNNGSFIKPGDTVEIKGDFINYLTVTHHLLANISSNNLHIHFLNSANNLGVINTMETVSNTSLPFIFYVDEQSGYDQEVTFKIQYSDTLYSDVQFFKTTLNPSYADIDTNNIILTLTSNGKLGYNNLYPLQGSGLRYNNSDSYLYEGGFTIAQSGSKISRCFSGESNFKIFNGIKPVIPASPADERWISVFSDSLSGISTLGLNIKMDAMEWNTPDKSDFVILNYTIYNNNTYNLDSLYAGIFCDWDIVNYLRNKTLFNNLLRLSYSWYTGQTNFYTGAKLLSSQNGYHYAFDYTETGSGGIDIYDGMSDMELFYALKTNRDSAGTSANGNDVADLISFGPFNIAGSDSITLSFALLASNSLYNIEQAAANAQILYDSLYISAPELILQTCSLNVFPNPSVGTINVLFNSKLNTTAEFKVYNVIGKEVYSKIGIKLYQGENRITLENKLLNGVYILKINTLNETFSAPFVIK